MRCNTVKQYGRILIFLLPLLTISSGYAKELLIAFGFDDPPFMMNKARGGIEVEVVREALKYVGHRFKPVQMSHPQAMENIRNRGTDATVNMLQKDDGSYYSDNYITFRNFAFSRRESGITIERIADLKGKRVIAWEDAHKALGPEFEALFAPTIKAPYRDKYIEVTHQADQVRMFWNEQTDVVVMDESIMLYHSKHLDTRPDIGRLVYHKIFPRTTAYRISFRDKKIRDDFNQGLRHIRKNGTYKAIYQKYLQ